MAKAKSTQLNDDDTPAVEVDEEGSSVNYSIGNLSDIDDGSGGLDVDEYEEVDEDEDSSTQKGSSSKLVDPYAPAESTGDVDEFLANVNDADEDWPQDYE